jgi:hypothetical protein
MLYEMDCMVIGQCAEGGGGGGGELEIDVP